MNSHQRRIERRRRTGVFELDLDVDHVEHPEPEDICPSTLSGLAGERVPFTLGEKLVLGTVIGALAVIITIILISGIRKL